MEATNDLPPGSPSERVWALAWREGEELATLTNLAEVAAAHADPESRLWVDLEDPTAAQLAELAAIMRLHPLVVEDIGERNQRAKIELTGDALHLVMFGLRYDGEIVADELDIVLGERFLLTSHEPALNLRRASFTRRDLAAHFGGGMDYVLWLLTDWLVDGYFPVFDQLGDEIDQLEDDVMRRPTTWLVERLFQIRHELLVIRHAVLPQREIFNQLTNRDLTLVKPERIIYFRDVYDHLIRLTDELDSFRELVGTTLDIYLSQVNNNLSEIVKRLTAVTVILAGMGAVAGIFGMSEAGLALDFREAIGFWVVALGVLGLGAAAIFYFRRIGWI